MILFFLFVNLFQNEKTIVLDYKKPIRMNTRSPRALVPNGLAIADDQTLLFFDREGKFLQQIGKPGQGPGEMQSLTEFAVGKKNWVGILDGASHFLSFFDADSGEFQRRFPSRALTMAANHGSDAFFLLQIERAQLDAHVNSNVSLADYQAPILRRVDYENLETLNEEKRDSFFHPPSKMVTRWSFNDRRHWVRQLGEKYFVIDELTPKIAIYHAKTLAFIESKDLKLPRFVNAPEKFADVPKMTGEEYRDWWYSFSRFLDLNVGNNRISVVYLVPGLNKDVVYHYMVVTMDENLNIVNVDQKVGHYQSDLYYFGSDERCYGFISDVGEGLFPSYEIKLESWK